MGRLSQLSIEVFPRAVMGRVISFSVSSPNSAPEDTAADSQTLNTGELTVNVLRSQVAMDPMELAKKLMSNNCYNWTSTLHERLPTSLQPRVFGSD